MKKHRAELAFVVGDVLIMEADQGNLACEEDPGEMWCEHINEGIREHKDAVTLWERQDATVRSADDEELTLIKILFPIVPTHGIWTQAILEPTTIPLTRQLYIPELQSEPIGFVNPGEGRIVIRDLFVQLCQIKKIWELECSSPTHGYREQMAWEEKMKDPATRFVEAWSVHRTNLCTACIWDDGEDFKEYVPGSEANSWSSTVGDSGVKF